MPPAIQYWNLLEPDRDLMNLAEAERRERSKQYTAACAQYDGKHKPSLKVSSEGVDNNVVLNLDGEAIDNIISFAAPSMPRLDLPDNSAQDWLREAWEFNDGASLVTDFLLFGCLMGQVFTRITPPIDGEYPEIKALNPANVTVYWSANDKDDVLWYEQITSTDRRRKQDIINLAEFGGSGWSIREYYLERNAWVLENSTDWPYQLGPIIDWQHLRDPRRYYGKSQLLATHLNDSVNRVASDIKSILRNHAAPKVIGKGVESSQVMATSIDGFLTIPADADVQVLEMQSDLASSMAYLDVLGSQHASQMRITRIQGGIEAYKQVTNLALKVAFMPMLQQNEQLHRNYDKGVIGISQRLLMLAGKPFDVTPTVKWADALPINPLEETTTVAQQIALGLLSKQTASAELDLDYENEQANLVVDPVSSPNPITMR